MKPTNLQTRSNRKGWIEYRFHYGPHKYRVLIQPGKTDIANVRVLRVRNTSQYMLASVTIDRKANIGERIKPEYLGDLAQAYVDNDKKGKLSGKIKPGRDIDPILNPNI